MATPIAELFVSVSADVSAAVNGLNSLNGQLDKTSSAFQQARPAALLFEAAAAGIFGALGSSVKVAADFEQQMANVRAVMTPDEANQFGEALNELALRLGRDTVFSSKEAGSAIEELIKAGLPAQSVLSGAAQGALDLAAATGVTTTEAATIAAQAINTFSLSGNDATRVVDRLSATANASASDISFLRFGMASAAGVAAGLGLSFDDTAVALGVLSNRFANGSDAGTSFKTFLERLIPSTKPATEEMKKLGIVTADGSNRFFDAQGHVKSLADISGILRTALGGLTDEQRQSALQTIFGTDAIRAALALYDAGSKGINEFKDATGQSGAASEAAKTRLGTLEGALNSLGGSIETVQIQIGSAYLPVLTQLAQAVNGVVGAFSKLDPQIRGQIVTFTLIGGAVLGVLGAFILFAPSIAAIGPAFAAVGSAIAPLLPVLAGIGVAVLLVSQAWQRNAGNIQRFAPIFAAIPDLLQEAFAGDIGGAVDDFIGVVASVSPRLAEILNAVRTTVSNLVASIQPRLIILGVAFEQAFSGNFGGALDILQGLIGTFSPQLASLVGVAREVASAVGDALGAAFVTLADFVQNTVLPTLGGLAENIFPTLQSAAQTLGDFWTNTLGPAFGVVAGFIGDTIVPKMQDLATNIIPTLQNAAVTLEQFWTTQLSPALSAVGDVLEADVTPKIQAFTSTAFDALNQGAQAVITFWNEQLIPTLQNPGPALDAFGTSIQNFTAQTQALGQSGALGSSAQALSDFFANFGTITQQVQSLGPLGESIVNFGNAINNLSTALFNIQGAITANAFGSFSDAFTNFAATAGPASPTVAAVGQTMATLGQQLQGVTDFFNNAANAINGLADAITNFSKAPQITLPGGLTVGNPAFVPGAGGAGAQLSPAGLTFGPNVPAGGGPVLNFNAPVTLNGTGDLNDFATAIAQAIQASARRVAPALDNAAHPALVQSA